MTNKHVLILVLRNFRISSVPFSIMVLNSRDREKTEMSLIVLLIHQHNHGVETHLLMALNEFPSRLSLVSFVIHAILAGKFVRSLLRRSNVDRLLNDTTDSGI